MVKSIELIVQRCGKDEAAAFTLCNRLLSDWYVNCSVTGEPISVADLKYWNVERQEAYKDAETGLKRYQELNNGKQRD